MALTDRPHSPVLQCGVARYGGLRTCSIIHPDIMVSAVVMKETIVLSQVALTGCMGGLPARDTRQARTVGLPSMGFHNVYGQEQTEVSKVNSRLTRQQLV